MEAVTPRIETERRSCWVVVMGEVGAVLVVVEEEEEEVAAAATYVAAAAALRQKMVPNSMA